MSPVRERYERYNQSSRSPSRTRGTSTQRSVSHSRSRQENKNLDLKYQRLSSFEKENASGTQDHKIKELIPVMREET